jgi:hypothetical protein
MFRPGIPGIIDLLMSIVSILIPWDGGGNYSTSESSYYFYANISIDINITNWYY